MPVESSWNSYTHTHTHTHACTHTHCITGRSSSSSGRALSSWLALVGCRARACCRVLPLAVCLTSTIKADSSLLPHSSPLRADMFCSPKAPRFSQFTTLQDRFLTCYVWYITSISLPKIVFKHLSDELQSRFLTSTYIQQISHPGVPPSLIETSAFVAKTKQTQVTINRNSSNVPVFLSHQLLRLFFHLFRELQRLLSAPTLLAVGALFRSLQSSIKDNCTLRKALLKEPSI